jgi:GDP-mannose 6-dehydrogenase
MEHGNIVPGRVTVLGLGYVGCVTAACLAELGHRVVGVDTDEFKVRSVLDGQAPFYEPGLEALVRKNREAGRLSASTSLEEALQASDIALIAVGTPSERNGNLDLRQLARVAEQIGAALAERTRPFVVAVRSTVFPGTCEQAVIPLMARSAAVSVVSNPEFLREGSAVKDFMKPSLLVVGGQDRAAVERVAALYAPLGVATCLVSLRTAEMIKYACNAFHAVKVGFANEIGTLAEGMGISGHEVMETLCRDTTLNISPAYLKPGFAFGGSCLPKDMRSLMSLARGAGVAAPFLDQVLASNDAVVDRAFQAIAKHGRQKIALFGLAFKPGTDDLRESPFVLLAERLLGRGFDLAIFDRNVQLARLTGANRAYIEREIPHLERMLAPTAEAALAGCKLVVIGHVDGADRAALLAALAGHTVLDLLGIAELQSHPAITYQGLCW